MVPSVASNCQAAILNSEEFRMIRDIQSPRISRPVIGESGIKNPYARLKLYSAFNGFVLVQPELDNRSAWVVK
jgi:hypothetical protein